MSDLRTLIVGGSGYNVAVADPRRDNFPNNFVGDLVPTEHGWMVVPPTCCPDGHAYADARLVSQFGLVHTLTKPPLTYVGLTGFEPATT